MPFTLLYLAILLLGIPAVRRARQFCRASTAFPSPRQRLTFRSSSGHLLSLCFHCLPSPRRRHLPRVPCSGHCLSAVLPLPFLLRKTSALHLPVPPPAGAGKTALVQRWLTGHSPPAPAPTTGFNIQALPSRPHDPVCIGWRWLAVNAPCCGCQLGRACPPLASPPSACPPSARLSSP